MRNISNDNVGHVYMRRALQLSEFGGPRVSPNPFVGAVIVADGRIIGEGYHRKFGEAHAEVNAIASVKESDRHLLGRSTMFVTLEPCSHFGKTPPCADLIIRTGIPHVVVAAEDPFLKDHESGIDRMRAHGIEVEIGMMGEEARWINRRFFTAHTLKRPYMLLKWAQSADGFIAGEGGKPVRFSTPFTSVLMHRERAMYDAIFVGTNTVVTDNPALTCRLWPCRQPDKRPLKTTFFSPRLEGDYNVVGEELVTTLPGESIPSFLHRLYTEFGITSLMVEGGKATLDSFMATGMAEEFRVEVSPRILGAGIPAPKLPSGLTLLDSACYDGNEISSYTIRKSD